MITSGDNTNIQTQLNTDSSQQNLNTNLLNTP